MSEDLLNLEKWEEITRGLYRFVIAAKVCYEIHVLYRADGTDIETAESSLYIVGNWHADSVNFFARECLSDKRPLYERLELAKKDYTEYVIPR